MKIKSIFFFLLLLACSKNLLAHYQFTGKVTEILDGKTAVVTTDEGKQVTFELLYIEVPEPEQQLSQTVFEHFKKMVSGKTVTLIVEGKYSKGLTGRMFEGGIDVGQRLVRDGAAWYNLPEQPYADVRRDYQQLESLARQEKRGVWGIEGMKTAWEFRAEQFAKKVEASNAKLKPAKEVPMWADIPDSQPKHQTGNPFSSGADGELSVDYDVYTDEGFVRTPTIFLNTILGESLLRKVIFQINYPFKGKNLKKGETRFNLILGFLSSFDTEGEEVIILTTNQERFRLGSGVWNKKRGTRTLTYNIDRASLAKICSYEKVLIKIGAYQGILDEQIIGAIRRILQAT